MTCWPRSLFFWAIMTALAASGPWNAHAEEMVTWCEIRTTNKEYYEAIQSVETSEGVEGNNVGPMAQRGRFHRAFETIYTHGNQDDFLIMAGDSNRVVRAMGLLCLRYCNMPRAKEIFLRDYSNDTHELVVYPGGCCGRVRAFNDVALDILTDDDFLETREIVARIPLRPGPAPPKPPTPSTPAAKPDNSEEKNPASQP